MNMKKSMLAVAIITLFIGNAVIPMCNAKEIKTEVLDSSEDKITIVDEGSANGTFIEDEEQPIKGSREIGLNGKIRFCKLNPITLTLAEE